MKIDNRKRVTNRILKDCLIQLLAHEPLRDITVKELCFEASINRSTFYAHYNDIASVLKEIEDEMYQELSKTIDASLLKDPNLIYYPIFSFFAKHAQMCQILLSHNSGSDFVMRALELGRQKFLFYNHLAKSQRTDEQLNYFYSYVSNGIIGLLKLWFASDMKNSITEISQTAEKLVLQGIGYLK